MPFSHRLTIDGFSFHLLGTYDDQGVLVNHHVDLDNPDYRSALQKAQVALRFAALRQTLDRYMIYEKASTLNEYDCEQIIMMIDELEGQRYFAMSDDQIKYGRQVRERRDSLAEEKLNVQPVRSSKDAGFVYLIQSDTGYYKIGKTRNPNNRMRTFNVKLPFEVSYACLIKTDHMSALENELHRLYASKRVNGEWFRLDEDDVAYIKGMA